MKRFAVALAACCVSASLVFAAVVPRPAPSLSVPLSVGDSFDLGRQKGKVVLLAFMLTTCPHCMQSCASIEKIHNELGPQGFQAIGIAINDNAKELVPYFVKELGLTFPMAIGTRDLAHSFLQHPPTLMLTVPQLVFIDKQGIIRHQYAGADSFIRWNEEENIRSTVKKLLAE